MATTPGMLQFLHVRVSLLTLADLYFQIQEASFPVLLVTASAPLRSAGKQAGVKAPEYLSPSPVPVLLAAEMKPA